MAELRSDAKLQLVERKNHLGSSMSLAKTKISKRSLKRGVSMRDTLIGVAVILLLFFGSKIFKFIHQIFSPSASAQAQAEAEQQTAQNVSNVSINTSGCTITVNQAKSRADNIYTALKGWTEDEKAVCMNLTRGWSPNLNLVAAVLTYGIYQGKTILQQYMEASNTLKLTDDDIKLIYREFGIRSFGWGWAEKKLSMIQAVQTYDSGQLNQFVTYLANKANIV